MNTALRPATLLIPGLLVLVGAASADPLPVPARGVCGGQVVRQFLQLPVTIEGEGSSLQAMIVRPVQTKPAPLALILHGSPRDAKSRRSKQLMFYHDQALEFVARGYCAVVFMRRGYGRSQGEWSESYRRRNEYDFVMAGRATAADARAVIKAMSGFEFVDDRAVLAVGQSAGGLGVVALAADPPANLKGVINFAGGRGSTRNNFVAGGSKLAEAYGVFGRTSRLPSLWIYTKNDKFFGPQLSKDFHRRFVQGGGRVQFRLLGDFGSDGHGLFSNRSGIAEWRPLVSSFLDKSGLPNWAEEPPLPSPDVQAMPEGMNQKGQDQWAVYLDRAPNKAWAFNRRTGAWGYRTRQDSVEAAVEGALKAAGEGAEVISINGKPVLQQPVEGEGGR